jgi:hypothetical protein
LAKGCAVLETRDVDGLQALWTLLDPKLDLLTFVQALVALAQDTTVVHKHVIRVCALDKAIAFGVAEPLDGSGFTIAHCLVSLSFQGLKNVLGSKATSRRLKNENPPERKSPGGCFQTQTWNLASLSDTISRFYERVKRDLLSSDD